MNWHPGVTYQAGDIVEYRTPVYDAFGEKLWLRSITGPRWWRRLMRRWADRHLIGWETAVYNVECVFPPDEPGPDSDQWGRI